MRLTLGGRDVRTQKTRCASVSRLKRRDSACDGQSVSFLPYRVPKQELSDHRMKSVSCSSPPIRGEEDWAEAAAHNQVLVETLNDALYYYSSQVDIVNIEQHI